MTIRCCWTLPIVLALAPPALAQSARLDASALLPALSQGNTDALAGSLRGSLIRAMPDPLYEKFSNWGKTERVANGLKWDGLKPRIQYKDKNDGKWQHLRAIALNPADNLVLDIRNLRQDEPGRLTFQLYLACPIRFEYRLLTWERGHKIWDRSYRARCRILAHLDCEARFGVEPGLLLPELVFRLRVLDAQVAYDDFVMEHAAGVGGETAELIGEIALRNLKRFNPALERDLLAKANAAIEKSADTKEVRISLYELLKKKGWLPARPAPSAMSP